MNPVIKNWIAIRTNEKVIISKGDRFEIVGEIEVPAWQDPTTNEIYLDGEATARIEAAKAKYLGVEYPPQQRT